MNNSIIERYFSKDVFPRIKRDFKFLVEKIIKSGFEYDLQIRDNYLNLYYKGNSLAKVTPQKTRDRYEISIHTKFFLGTSAANDARFHPPPQEKDNEEKSKYVRLTVPSSLLHVLLQKEYLDQFSANIKEVGFQEEMTFEQMLITDNVNNPNLIIIDRQVRERGREIRTKIDLLGLSRIKSEDYQFCVIEVKLGNNPELAGKVADQLKGYMWRIDDNFDDYKKCYQLNIQQKQELGLINANLTPEIVRPVLGMVIVGGYSGIAKKAIEMLKSKVPDIRVLQLQNLIDIEKTM
jgi:hypothetical protein